MAIETGSAGPRNGETRDRAGSRVSGSALDYAQDTAPSTVKHPALAAASIAAGDSTTGAAALAVQYAADGKPEPVAVKALVAQGVDPLEAGRIARRAYRLASAPEPTITATLAAAPRAEDQDRGAPAAAPAPPRGRDQGKPTTSTTSKAATTSKARGWRASSLIDLWREPLPRWLIRDWLAEDDVGLLYGAANAGKTAVTVGLVCAVATGRPWAGYEVRQGPVVMIVSEGRRGLGKRFRAWCQRHQHHQPLPVTIVDRLQPLNADDGAALREVLASLPEPPALVVIDHYRGHLDGSEDSSDDGAPWFRALRASLPPGSACLVLHHAGKDGTDRGTSVLRDDPDMTARVSGGGNTKFTKVTMVKSRESEERPVLQFALRAWTVQGMTDDRGRPITAVLAEHKPAATTTDRPETPEEREAREAKVQEAQEAAAALERKRLQEIDHLVLQALQKAQEGGCLPSTAEDGGRLTASAILQRYGLERSDITAAEIRASVQRQVEAGTIVRVQVGIKRDKSPRMAYAPACTTSAEPLHNLVEQGLDNG